MAMIHRKNTRMRALQASREQWYMSGLIFISSPVSVEYTPTEIVFEIIMFEIWSLVKCIPNSQGTDIIKGIIMARVTPYREERQADAMGRCITVRTAPIIPTKSCPQVEAVNFLLSGALIQPKMKRQMDSSVQKMEVNCTACSLLATWVRTAKVGIHPQIVASMPMRMKTQMHIKTPNLSEHGFDLSCSACSYAVFWISYGDCMKQKKGVMMRHAAATTKYIFCPKNPTMMGPASAPKPKAPCEKDIHSPTSSLGGAIMVQMQAETTKQQLKNFRMLNAMHCAILVFIQTMTTLKMTISRQEMMRIVWCFSRSLYTPRTLQRMAAMRVDTEIMTKMMEQSVSSMPASAAMKGMSAPTELIGMAVMKWPNMYKTRYALDEGISFNFILSKDWKAEEKAGKELEVGIETGMD